MSEEPKACPWCHHPNYVGLQTESGYFNGVIGLTEWRSRGYCAGCGTKGPWHRDVYHNPEDSATAAIKAWNRRETGPATQAVLDMVRHYIEQFDGGVIGDLGKMIGAKKLDDFLEEWA